MIREKIKWTGPLSLPDDLEVNKLYFSLWRQKRIVVIKKENELVAFVDSCPHQGASFSGGHCVNGNIVCPFHKYSFRLNDGSGLNTPGQNLELLKVEQRETAIYVGTRYTSLSLFGIDLW